MPSVRVVGSVLLLRVAVPALGQAQVPVPEHLEEVRRAILQRARADSIPSLVLAVVKNGRVIWEEAFGFRNLETRAPATTTTSYAVASVTKPLTATALMVLVQQGRLALDNPANDYLEPPAIQAQLGSPEAVTLRRLANHTSGLSRHDLYYSEDEPDPPLSTEERIRRYGQVVRRPGESYEYSNLGYMILAHIIARRSQRAFPDAMRQLVFGPLGMAHSSVGPPRGRLDEVALSYDGTRRPVSVRDVGSSGAGGVYSTAGDLARFGMLHGDTVHLPGSGRQLLSRSALASMREPLVQTDSGVWYGIGWVIDRANFGVETIYHSGSNGASASMLAVVPSEGLVVAALANCLTALPGWAAREIVHAFGPRTTPDVHPPTYPTARIGTEPYHPTSDWTGRWEGIIQAPDTRVSLILELTERGPILATLADAPPENASGVRIEDGYLRGSFSGQILNPDTMGSRYRLHFKLKRDGDRLTGSVTAGSVARERVITLSYWTDLRRPPR